MPTAPLAKIVRHCQKILRPESFSDWDGAVNGLQVENSGAVTKIAAAVDASLATIKLAIAAQARLLIVHHGLFWSPTIPWTGRRREMLDLLLKNDLAVYSSHLPLDAHPRLGNNARLCAALGFKNLQPFFLEKGRHIGWRTRTKISRDVLAQQLAAALGCPPLLLPGGGAQCERIGVVTGGAGSELKPGGAGRRGHFHHRRRSALDLRPGGRIGIERLLRRPLRHRDLRRQSPRRRLVKYLPPSLDFPGPSNRPLMLQSEKLRVGGNGRSQNQIGAHGCRRRDDIAPIPAERGGLLQSQRGGSQWPR